jgi:hypothetical protein
LIVGKQVISHHHTLQLVEGVDGSSCMHNKITGLILHTSPDNLSILLIFARRATVPQIVA